jgi:hypothetical protein
MDKANIIKQIKNISKGNKAKVKFINKKTNKTKEVIFDPSDDGFDNLNELSKKDIMIGITCTILASGLVSCKKEESGFGYNIGYKWIAYNLDKTSNSSKIIVTPTGEKEIKIDSSDTARSGWAGHGMYVNIIPSPEELQIASFGAAISAEKRYNNGQGKPSSLAVDVTEVEISKSPGYESSKGDPLDSIKDHKSYEDGLSYIKKHPDQWEKFKQENPLSKYKNI